MNVSTLSSLSSPPCIRRVGLGVLLLSLIVATIRPVKAQVFWQSTSRGMEGGMIDELMATRDRTVYASLAGGLYVLPSGASKWQRLSPPPFTVAWSLAETPEGTLLAGTDRGINRSTDGGFTWSLPFNVPNVGHFAFGPDGAILGIDRSGNGGGPNAASYLYLSNDDGATWSSLRVRSDMAPGPNGALTESGDILFLSWQGVKSSGEDGTLRLLGPRDSATAFAARGDVIVAVAADSLFISPDRGENWENRGTVESDIRELVIEGDNEVLFVRANGLTRYSLASREAEPLLDGRTTAFAIDAAGSYWAGSDDRILRSDDRGETWTPWDGNVHGMAIVDVLEDRAGDRLFAIGITGAYQGGVNGPATLYASEHNITTWTALANDVHPVLLDVDRNGALYVARRKIDTVTVGGNVWSVEHLLPHRSTDGGATLIPLADSGTIVTHDFSQATTLLIVMRDDLLISDDGGSSWASLSVSNPEWRTDHADERFAWGYVAPDGAIVTSTYEQNGLEYVDAATYRIDPATGGVTLIQDDLLIMRSGTAADGSAIAFIGMIDSSLPPGEDEITRSGLYRSTDNGMSWQFAFDFPGPKRRFPAWDLFASGVSTALLGINGEMWRTPDNGTTWEPLQGSIIESISALPGGAVAGIRDRAVVVSADDGATWSVQPIDPSGENPLSFLSFAALEDGTWLGGSNGLGVFRGTRTTDVAEHDETVDKPRLSFSLSGSILTVDVPADLGAVKTVGIFNINGELLAGGGRDTRFDVSALPSGAHFVVAICENGTAMCMMRRRAGMDG